MRAVKLAVPLLLTSVVFASALGSNAHAMPLREATSEYKQAVKQFEIAIYRRGYDRHSKLLVQELEEAAIRMRSASFHPQRLDRLECAWREIQHLHPRVEVAIFSASPTCRHRPDIELEQCWERVAYAYVELAHAIACVCGSVEQATIPAGPPLGLAYPDTALPYGGLPHSSYLREPSIPPTGFGRSQGSRAVAPNPHVLGQQPEPMAFGPARGTSMLRTSPLPQDIRDGYGSESLDRGEFRAMLVQSVLQRMAGELDR